MSDSPQSAPGPRVPRLGWLIAFIVFVAVVAVAWQALKSTPKIKSAPFEKYGKAPTFTFTDQTGKPFSSEELKGKVWAACFIFTQCKGPCPAVTSRMAALNQQLGKVRDKVTLVSFTVDPENDTPEVLAKYGQAAGADPKTWKFLTAPQEEIQRVVIKGLFQPIVKEPDGNLAHSTRVVLVDANGEIRAFVDTQAPEAEQKLLLDIGALLREPASVNSGGTPKK